MEEKRAFMRIPTRLGGFLRLLPDPDDIQVFRESPFFGSTSGTCHDPREAGMSEALHDMLCAINAKLDMLLSMKGRDDLAALESDLHPVFHVGHRISGRRPRAGRSRSAPSRSMTGG